MVLPVEEFNKERGFIRVRHFTTVLTEAQLETQEAEAEESLGKESHNLLQLDNVIPFHRQTMNRLNQRAQSQNILAL